MAVSTDVPGRVPVSIGTHAFMCEAAIERTTVPVMRQQADTSFEPGEASLNPQGLWRRSQESWHHGAGQEFLDGRRGLSSYSQVSQDPERFRSSKGIDPWTKGQVSLLPPTLKVWSTTSTNLYLAVAQEPTSSVFILYVADGNNLYWSGVPFSGLNSIALQQGTGWTATNATIGSPGDFFSLTATSAAAVSATSPTGTNGIPVEAGRRYGFAFSSLYGFGGAAKTPRVNVTWYTAAGATISSTTPAVAAGTDAAQRNIISDAIAPATAAFASVTISYTTNWANGELHWVYFVAFGPYDDVTAIGSPDGWYTSNIQAGEAAQPIQSIATNGTYVWAALGTSGLHRTTASWNSSTANVPAAPAGGQVSMVAYCAPFLLAAGSVGVTSTLQNSLWLVTSPLGPPAPALSLIKTHDNPAFVWVGAASGRNCVYAWGNSGGTGEIYKVLFDPNTGSLATAASPATSWIDGETIHSLVFYAGGAILGTGKGVRIGQADGAGNIDYGPLIPTDWPVRCLEPQDRYCWFGWTKYDATNSGLGRIDLGFLTDTLTPAWASDLMTADTTTGDTVACVTFAPYGYLANQRPPVRVFTVAGKGVYIEDPGSRIATGQFLTGTIRFSTSEPKTARSVDLRHHALPAGGTVAVEMQRDSSGTWTSLGTSSTTGSYGPAAPLDAGSLSAEALEFRATLTRPTPAGTDFTQSPELTRWTAKVLPTPSTVDETFTIPIIMRADSLTGQGDGTPYPIDVAAEIAYLKGLERTRAIIDIQIGEELVSSCYVAGSQFKQDSWNEKRTTPEGIYAIQIATARG